MPGRGTKVKNYRYEARLVARGYSQIGGIDFRETFAPVASMITVRLFLSLMQYDQDLSLCSLILKRRFSTEILKKTY